MASGDLDTIDEREPSKSTTTPLLDALRTYSGTHCKRAQQGQLNTVFGHPRYLIKSAETKKPPNLPESGKFDGNVS